MTDATILSNIVAVNLNSGNDPFQTDYNCGWPLSGSLALFPSTTTCDQPDGVFCNMFRVSSFQNLLPCLESETLLP